MFPPGSMTCQLFPASAAGDSKNNITAIFDIFINLTPAWIKTALPGRVYIRYTVLILLVLNFKGGVGVGNTSTSCTTYSNIASLEWDFNCAISNGIF